MANAFLPSISELLRSAWGVLRKQTVLTQVTLWMIGIPLYATLTIDKILPSDHPLDQSPYHEFVILSSEFEILADIVIILLAILMFWGYTSILFVGRRQVVNRAGRAKSSFAIVRKESRSYIIPLFLTNILLQCLTFLWGLLFFLPLLLLLLTIPKCPPWAFFTLPSLRLLPDLLERCMFILILLPLLIPSLLFWFRRIFYNVIVTTEDISYRDALKRSRDTVRGKLGSVFVRLLGVALICFVPAILLDILFTTVIPSFDPRLLLLSDILLSVLYSFGLLFYLLSQIELYGALRKTMPLEVTS